MRDRSHHKNEEEYEKDSASGDIESGEAASAKKAPLPKRSIRNIPISHKHPKNIDAMPDWSEDQPHARKKEAHSKQDSAARNDARNDDESDQQKYDQNDAQDAYYHHGKRHEGHQNHAHTHQGGSVHAHTDEDQDDEPVYYTRKLEPNCNDDFADDESRGEEGEDAVREDEYEEAEEKPKKTRTTKKSGKRIVAPVIAPELDEDNDSNGNGIHDDEEKDFSAFASNRHGHAHEHAHSHGTGHGQSKASHKAAGRNKDDDNGPSSHFAPIRSKNHGRTKKRILTAIIAVVLLALILSQTLMVKASVIVKTSNEGMDLPRTALTAPVAYKVFTKNSEKTLSIEEVQTVAVSKKATGNIVIYNNYSDEPYELIKTTRVSTENGSIYRLLEDVMVPARKTSGGKTTPGSVTVKVEADKAGSEYNAKGGLDLKFPGLIPGTAKYINIYAKTAANFTGGASGTQTDTSSPQIKDAVEAAKADIEKAAGDAFATEDTSVFILPDSFNTATSIASTKTANGKTDVVVRFTTKAVGLSKEQLVASINAITADKGMTVVEGNLSSLTYTVEETSDLAIVNGSLAVSVEGKLSGEYTGDGQSLRESLAGMRVPEAAKLVSEKVPGSTAEISVWPIWKNSLPSNPEKITVTIE